MRAAGIELNRERAEGELYAGTISRTLEVGDRSDSRISFHVVQLVANGQGPYSPLATTVLSPYNFSSRGPLPGIGSSPIVLMAGGHPAAEIPEQQWAPFDRHGFMAYRLAMMTFTCTAFLALWDLVRRLAGAGAWLDFSLDSLGNTVVPLLLFFNSTGNLSVNVVGGSSAGIVHFFFQYWNTIPFGVAIVFFPLLLLGLWRAFRRWPWALVATVVVPFALFTIYWGAFSSGGMLREGLQTWVLTLVAVIACEQAARGFGWLRSTPIRVLLTLRVVEVLAVAALPTLVSRHELLGNAFEPSDAVAVAAMLGFGAALAALVWTAASRPELSPGRSGTSGAQSSATR